MIIYNFSCIKTGDILSRLLLLKVFASFWVVTFFQRVNIFFMKSCIKDKIFQRIQWSWTDFFSKFLKIQNKKFRNVNSSDNVFLESLFLLRLALFWLLIVWIFECFILFFNLFWGFRLFTIISKFFGLIFVSFWIKKQIKRFVICYKGFKFLCDFGYEIGFLPSH